MTDSRLALLAGLFVVPVLLLWLGHHLRRRPPAWPPVFWGAVIGYVAGMLVMLVAIHYPPVLWASGGWRTAAVHWGMVVGAGVGAVVGRLTRGRRGDLGGDSRGEKTRQILDAHEQAITEYGDVFRDLAK
ncbi:MAG: hypothetical protein KY467_14920 [Gemmatimonadetes bacterium]|nr:hypothetical protein [Gemmatimonadota bacterium]